MHSRRLRPCSFWSAPRIGTSGKLQHGKSAIHRLPVTLRKLRVKYDKSDWLRIRNYYSARVQRFGPTERLRFLVLTKRSAASRDENAQDDDGDVMTAIEKNHVRTHKHLRGGWPKFIAGRLQIPQKYQA